MRAESIIEIKRPSPYLSPDGKKIGIAMGITAGVGTIIGGGAWFLLSPQAAHLRERAAHLFGIKKTENPSWSIHLPSMIEDDDDPNKIKSAISIGFLDRISVYPVKLSKINPLTNEQVVITVAEATVNEFTLFPEARDFQALEKLTMYASPLVHPRLADGYRLNGALIDKEARIPVKGILQITYGSENFIPSSGIRRIDFGIVGVCAQSLTQLHLDTKAAKDEDLTSLLGKVIFVPVSKSEYRSKSNKGVFNLELTDQKSFGNWVID